MTTYSAIRKVEREIEKLNEEIDLRIVRGLSYRALSREHKSLVSELRALKRQPIESSWSKSLLTRFNRYASVFLL